MERHDEEITPGGTDAHEETTENLGLGVAGREIAGQVDVPGATEQGARARGSRLEPDLGAEAGTPTGPDPDEE